MKGARVLVVDDDRVTRRIVAVKLSGLGYRVVEAEDGREALERVEEEPPDLMIVDSLMPRLNGLQTVRALRENPDPRISALPVVMLTARRGERDVVEGLEAGVDDYIVKPFSTDELAARLRTVLRRAGRR
ncbi:response regulator [Rubrobacter taiwanensis]|jgi:DNA-binding response OmpR family regulator|uniref:Response regulator n=1 Tax=Rubrobacter taiwanensis TaxID=185139 RepID=A0A4R1BGY8_9ACTN|nr:response regulator [Rubrobacter taiwanensis]TCJ16437.1 response regulator [Rubrobacter taiwanensis]